MSDTLTSGLLARIESFEAELGRLKAELGGSAVATQCDADDLTPPQPVAEEPLRRDLLRSGAVALGTIAAAALAARPATAADGDPLILGNSHTSSSQTSISCSGFGQVAFTVTAASTTSGTGIRGITNSPSGVGVFGVHFNVNGSGEGVLGRSISPTGVGVRGHAENGGTAILGELTTNTSANGIGVFGLNNAFFAGPVSGGGGFGVYGFSRRGHGLVGATGTTGGAAVVGATNSIAGAWAGAFHGPVAVVGDLLVSGAKSAAVPFPDGTNRQLYCVESPESWFEDFGTGTLVNGKAEIAIEPGFGAVAETDNYHVFVTGYDCDHLLHVTRRTSRGFTVEADATLAALKGRKDTALSGTFSWRVVAKRKDITGGRLTVVTMPMEPLLPPIQDR